MLGVLPASGGYVAIAGNALCASEWRGTFKADPVDVSSFCGVATFSPPVLPTQSQVAGALFGATWGSFSDHIATVLDAEVEVKGFWSTLQAPHQSPFYLVAGVTYGPMVLGVGDGGGKQVTAGSPPTYHGAAYVLPAFLVTEVMVQTAVRDVVRVEFKAVNRGSFQYGLVS